MPAESARPPVVGYRAFVRFGLALVAIVGVVVLSLIALVRDAPVTVLIANLILIGLLTILARRVFPRKMRVEDL